MFTNFLRSFLFMGLGLLWGGLAQAQCPPGMYPFQFAPSQPASCAPIPGNGNQQAPQWERRWGAVATDAANGSFGVSTDKSSKQEASKVALSGCRQQGGANCKIEAVYDNECVAVVVGGGAYNVPTQTTLDEAVATGMKTCRDAGGKDCHVHYSACSLPVRIR